MSYPHYYYAHPASAMLDDDFTQPSRHRFGPGPRSFRPDPYARLAAPSPAPYRPAHAGFFRDAPPHVSSHAGYYAAAEVDDDDDVLLREEEEARRHLEVIQRRREAARLAAERERAERAHRAEYEAFVAARDAAARRSREDAIKREIAQQQALARARAQAAEQDRIRKEVEKQVKLQILAQQQVQEQVARQQRLQREVEARRQRDEQLLAGARAQHDAQQAFLHHIRNQRQQQQQQQQQQVAARSACARPRIEGRPAHPLLALFAPEQFAAEEKKKKEVKPAPASKPVRTAPSTPPPAPTPKKDEKKDSVQPAVPRGLNDLLSHVLGLQLDHADNDEKAAEASKDGPGNTKVIDDLNKILGQMGLVFEPEDDKTTTEAPKAESSQKAVEHKSATPEPAAAKRPESPSKPACECSHSDNQSFEPAMIGLPDFLKYAFEAAMNDGCPASCAPASKKADKGKGVAEGEKKPRAAQPAVPASKPAPAQQAAESGPEPKATPADSISKLKSIANEFALARDSFTFPERLVFGPTASASDPQHPPALLFNKINSPYHAQTNKLLQLLLAADNVASDGDASVRQERKALVKELEKEIELLEQKRDQVWEEVRGQRERGEEEIEVESVSSGASVVDPVEHAEQHGNECESTESEAVIIEAPVETFNSESAHTPNVPEPASETTDESEVAGFDVPAAAAEKTVEPEQAAESARLEGEAIKDDAPAAAAEKTVEPEQAAESARLEGEAIKDDAPADVKPEEKASQISTPLPELERKQSRQATVEDETKEDEYEVL